MKNRLIKALARLASEPYQDAYLVNGTSDEYILPEDLVEDVVSLYFLSGKSQYKHLFTDKQQKEMKELLKAIRALGDDFWDFPEFSDAASLVHENLLWKDLRSRSVDCLKSLNYNIDDLSLFEK